MNNRTDMKYNIRVFFKRTTLPICSAVFFLVLFIKSYRLLTTYAVNPLYFASLLLAVPVLFFAGFSVYLNVKDMWVGQCVKISLVFIVIFAIAYNLGYTYFLNEATNQIITDTAKYSRSVRLSSLYDDRHLEIFPDSIPENAHDISFTYIPLYRYGKESVTLYFKSDKNTVNELEADAKDRCLWYSTPEIAKQLDIQMQYEHYKYTPYESNAADPLPDDFTIYVFASNHLEEDEFGILTYAAFSPDRGEVIFNSRFWWN